MAYCVQLGQIRENSLESKWKDGVENKTEETRFFCRKEKATEHNTHANKLRLFKSVMQRIVTCNSSCLSHVRALMSYFAKIQITN